MKIILLTLATLFTMSSNASLFDFLRSHPTAARIINNSANIQFGTKQSVSIVSANDEQQCVEAVHLAIQSQKDSPNKLGLLNAASLTSKAYKGSLEGNFTQKFKGEGFFARDLKRGLSNDSYINVNSFSGVNIPHQINGCSKFTKITSVTKSKFKEKVCRVISHELSGERYKVLFCEGDNSAYTDFLDLESTLIKTYKEIM